MKNTKKIFNKVYIFSHDHHGHYLLSLKIFNDQDIWNWCKRFQVFMQKKNLHT